MFKSFFFVTPAFLLCPAVIEYRSLRKLEGQYLIYFEHIPSSHDILNELGMSPGSQVLSPKFGIAVSCLITCGNLSLRNFEIICEILLVITTVLITVLDCDFSKLSLLAHCT